MGLDNACFRDVSVNFWFSNHQPPRSNETVALLLSFWSSTWVSPGSSCSSSLPPSSSSSIILPAGTMRVLGFILAERAERVLGFVLAERAERVLGFVERQNRCKAILCSELQSISAILSFCKVNVSGFGFKLYGRARRARWARRARVRVCRKQEAETRLDVAMILWS